MSLDWTIAELDPAKRAEVFPPDENGLMNDNLHVLIWLTIPTGVCHVTAKNVDEFWLRVNMWQRTIGSGFTRIVEGADPEPFLVENKHVQASIGLRTNAGSLTRAQFLKNLAEAHERVYPLVTR